MRLLAAILDRYALWRKGREMGYLTKQMDDLRNSYKVFKNFDEALEYIDKSKEIYQRAKVIITQIREIEERQIGRAYSEESREAIKERIGKIKLWEKEGEEMLEHITAVRELLTIFREGKQSGIKETIANILTWLKLETPIIKVTPQDKVIEGKRWKALIIENRWGKPWDDMPLEVRKKHLELKRFIEYTGGKFFYTVIPGRGAEIVIMFPQELLQQGFKKG
jgi:hypothetical protein